MPAPGDNETINTTEELLELLPKAVLTLDFDYRITYANAAARKISRIEAAHLNGPTHWELYPATVGTVTEQVYRQVMTERVPLEFEVHYEPYALWLALNVFPISTGIAVLYRDITRLKAVEKERAELSRQLRQVLDVTTDGIVMLDRNYNFTFLNRRAKDLLGPQRDAEGKNLWKEFPATLQPGTPYAATYKAAMDDGVPGSFEIHYPAPTNLWLGLDVYPAEDGIIVFSRDLTESRRAAQELRERTEEIERQAAEIEAVYQTAPIGLALFEPKDFRYVRLNARQAEFFGMPPEKLIGKTVTEMAPIPGVQEMFEHVRDGGHIVNQPLEGELVGRPGEHRYWTVNYSPVVGPDGEVQAISAASLEITQQKKAEVALVQSEKLAAVGRLAASIAHEINNPLESVTNLLYLIRTSDGLPESVRHYVETAESELARVSQIATQTLRFHRQSSRPTALSAAQILDGVMSLFATRVMNSHVSVQVRNTSRTTVTVLENEIRQVLNNLIGNAIDAMPSGGSLWLRARDAKDPAGRAGILFTVADTGHGMSRETLARIFEPFFTTKEMEGTGLGLWISAEIVKRHEGRIRVRTGEKKVHGTVFQLFLPRESHVAARGEGRIPAVQ